MTKVAKIKEETESQPKYFGMNIFQRMNAVMGDVSYIQKSPPKKDPNGKPVVPYSSAKHDDVTALTRDVLQAWGVYSYPVALHRTRDGNMTELDGVYRFQNIDDKEDFVDIHSSGYGVDNQDKGVGKAISYFVKYALLKGLNLETGDDPENDSIEHVPKAKGIENIGGSPRKDIDKESVKKMYDQALTLLNNVATTDKLKEIWTAQYKGRTVYSEEQWHDIELAKERAKEEIEQGVR